MSNTELLNSKNADSMRTRRFQQLKVELHEQLISNVDFAVLRSVDPRVVRDELRKGAEQLCRLHSDLLSQTERIRLVDELIDEALGLGPLEPLMHDPTISDILINGPDYVFVERNGKLERTTVTFRDNQHLVEIVQKLVSQVGRRIDESSPMVDARLSDGSRLNAVIQPLALNGALVAIRRFAAKPITPGKLIARKSATPEMIEFLAACVSARMNILVSGSTGSGKTTLLNIISSFIPENERVVTIEDAAELQLQHPHIARMETRPPNLEGNGEITSRELVRNALRMRPDRIIVGECRGDEAFDMLQAMNTGHDGGMSTIHSNDAKDALSRLEMLVGMAAPELPMWFIHRMIASAIDIVVHLNRLSDGRRVVSQVSEITGIQGDAIGMHDVFRYQQTGMDEANNALGHFEACGIVPNCLMRLRACGLSIAPDLFEEREITFDRIDQLRGT